jgi:hypothetical protein
MDHKKEEARSIKKIGKDMEVLIEIQKIESKEMMIFKNSLKNRLLALDQNHD